MPDRCSTLGTFYSCRFEHLGELEDINRAVEYQTLAVQLAPEGHAEMPHWLGALGRSYCSRFARVRKLEDIDRAIECHNKALELAPAGDIDIPRRYNNLSNSYSVRFELLGGITDLHRAIKCSHQAVVLAPNEHAAKSKWLCNFSQVLRLRFKHFNEPEDILNSIEVATQALQLLPQDDGFIPGIQYILGGSYLSFYNRSKRPEHRDAALQYFEAAARSPAGRLDARFLASRAWAHLLSAPGDPTSLVAHSKAMALLPQVVWLGTTVGRRYESVEKLGDLATEAAAAAISAQEYGLALGWLEEGRSIVWSQMLQLRSPVDALATVNSALAERLQRVSRGLEQNTTRAGDTGPLSNRIAFEQVTIQHHRLVGEYNDLIDQARSLPGFHDFMRPRKAANLMPAARRGPVVVVNVHISRCDALILRPGSDDIAHVPLPSLSHDGVGQLHSLMLTTLKANGIRERSMSGLKGQPGDHFEQILTALWNNLVNPVLDFLGYTVSENKRDTRYETPNLLPTEQTSG